MEELKITRERAIKRMEWILKHETYCSDKLSHAAINMAITALRSAAPENKPLTLEQLREMDGEPVWTVPLDGTGCGEWTIIAIGAQIEMLKALSPDTAYEECNYGKTWLAYARKPEK